MPQPLLAVVSFVREHGLNALTERYAIKQRRHGVFPNLVLLGYNQVRSPLGEKVVQQCRGIILDEADDWRVVSYPFDKFFNRGEPGVASLNWETARVEEKLDGSLCTWYWYSGQWNVATRGVPDASTPPDGTDIVFAQLFERTRQALGYQMPTDPDLCYMFELMVPENRVVVQHASSRLVLIGARDMRTLAECALEAQTQWENWEVASSFPLRTLDEIVAAAAQLPPIEAEGYVVRDKDFNRIKVKSPAYIALAHLKESTTASVKNILRLVVAHEDAEFLSYFPHLRERFSDVRGRYEALCQGTDDFLAHLQTQSWVSKGEIARYIAGRPDKAALFALLDGKVADAHEFYAQQAAQRIETLLVLLHLKEGKTRASDE